MEKLLANEVTIFPEKIKTPNCKKSLPGVQMFK